MWRMPPTILVVDDEPLIRWTLSERLGQDGHAIVEAETAKTALARFGPDIELALVVQKALETTRLRREVKALRASRSEPYAIARIVGDSSPVQALKALLQKVA